MATDVIILNRMYVGDYLGDNIGHEVINLMKSDNDDNKNYIYINPYGRINENFYKNKWKASYILLTRWCVRKYDKHSQSMLEILAKATNLIFWEDEVPKHKENLDNLDKIKNKVLKLAQNYGIINNWTKWHKKETKTYGDYISYISTAYKNIKKTNKTNYDDKEKEFIHEIHLEYLKENKIKYQKDLEEIYKYNAGNKKALYLTYRVEGKIQKVANDKRIYLVDKNYKGMDNNEIIINVNQNNSKDPLNFSKQSLKQYITNGHNGKKNLEDVYRNVKDKLIDKQQYWGEGNSTWTYKNMTDSNNKDKDFYIEPNKNSANIIGIIRKSYDELVYSNLFYYIFKEYPKLFYEFATSANEGIDTGGLGIPKEQISESDIEVVREEGNIDLLIHYPKQKTVIVIENKIKSGINGIIKNSDGKEIGNQLSKYVHYTYGYRVKQNSSKTNYNYKEFSQDEIEIRPFGNKTIDQSDYNRKFYIFVPKYSDLNNNIADINLTICDVIKKAQKLQTNNIQYEYEIVNYRKIYNFFKRYENNSKYKYMDEFLYAIKNHIYDVDNIQERQMFERFAERIEELE